MRRELWERPVTYAAIGATQASDLLSFPPSGYRPMERKARIGHGDARFEYASTAVMTWAVQRNSGMVVNVAQAPASVSAMTYTPIEFDETGEPKPRPDDDEVLYAADGTRAVGPGDSAVLGIPFGPFRLKAPVRVVYIVREPKRRGFAYGTLPGHPERGEEGWIVEQREDGSVWITVRAFSRPGGPGWWAVYPVLRIVQEVYTRRYLRALAGPLDD
jgi:uncharacterized protein (UPF0548 family)